MAGKTRKETLSSSIAAALRKRIVRGEIAAGEKINLDRLRETLDVSISPLREAVSRLVPEGLLVFEDQRGYSVSRMSSDNLAEVTRLRCTLETMALREAIARGDLDWEGQVIGALYRLRHVGDDPQGVAPAEAWEEAHGAFHLALISGCGMPLLLQFCTTLRAMQDRYRRQVLTRVPKGRDVQAEHDAIATATTQREADRACALLAAHIEATGAFLQACQAAGPGEP